MRLIDAEELEELAYEMFVHARTPGEQIVANTIKDMIDNAPTIEAVTVIRCKDCKWWDQKGDSKYGYCHACKHGHRSEHWEIGIYRIYGGDWYCADGERREENG